MNVVGSLAAAAATVQQELTVVAEQFQQTALEIIAGPGGVLVLVFALIGVAVLVFDAGSVVVRFVRRGIARRSPTPTPIARARGLASLGAAPAEISRAVGLARDVLTLAIPVELASRPKVPATAETATRKCSAESARPAASQPEDHAGKAHSRVTAAATAGARPLPSYHSRNANAPHFGEAA